MPCGSTNIVPSAFSLATIPSLKGSTEPGTILSISPSGSVSFSNTSTLIVALLNSTAVSSTASGALFAGTFIVTSAVLLPPLPSLIVYSNVSLPEKVAFGV